MNASKRVFTADTRFPVTSAMLVVSALAVSTAFAQTTTSTVRTFYANGLLESVTQDGVTTSYTYYPSGDLNMMTQPGARVTTYSNYKRGIAQREDQPEGVVVLREVNDLGHVTSITNGENFKTIFGVDALGRVTSVSYPRSGSNPTTIVYAAYSSGNPEKATLKRGSFTEVHTYDEFGQLKTKNSNGLKTSFEYDTLWRKTFESNRYTTELNPPGRNFDYDELDRLTQVTWPDGNTTVHTYGDNASRPTHVVVNERNYTTQHVYRAFGEPGSAELVAQLTPDGLADIAMNRNVRGQVTTMTQGGFSRVYAYNSNYYLSSVTNPETGITQYGRDIAGNMTSAQVGASAVTLFGYDERNRQTSTTYPAGTPSVTKTYTKNDKLATVSSSDASTLYEYDANDNLVALSRIVDDWPLRAQFDYDGNDQLSTLTYPISASIVNYSPDVFGRPTKVSGYINSVAYWPSGMPRQIDYANRTTSEYPQNSRLWASGFSTRKSSANYLDSNYLYDSVGNLTGVHDAVDAVYNRAMIYDKVDRITDVSGPWGSGTIAYDLVGNITSHTIGGPALGYTYDASNRLSATSGRRNTSNSYDVYGNIVDNSLNTYGFDDASNLRCVNCASPTNKIEYAYDGSNQRVRVAKSGVKVYELYGPGGNLLFEYTPTTNQQVEHIYFGSKRIAQRVLP